MALVQPFRGTYYNLNTNDLSDIIIPPYDAIPVADEEKYRKKSPYNFAHVDLSTKPEDDYSHSLTHLNQWREKGILKETPEPCYFLYQQTFQAFGQKHTRNTLLCTVGLHDFSKGIIRPHENTFGKYKADRLQLLKKTKMNLSHIFGMVKDPEGFLSTQFEKWAFEAPFLKAKSEDGTEHFIWKVEEKKAPDIKAFFSDQPIYIVDGHHRYESSLMYAREMGVEEKFDHPASRTTMCIANAYDPGLVVFPTHRILRKGFLSGLTRSAIEKDFDVAETTPEAIKTFVLKADPTPRFGLLWNDVCYMLTPKNWIKEGSTLGASVTKLAVTWSDHKFLKNFCGVDDTNRGQRIRYEKDIDFTISLKNEADLIVFHAPPAVTDVLAVADENRFMPQKSTFFIPKLAGGLIMRQQ